MKVPDIYNLSNLRINDDEIFENLLSNEKLKIERIISPNTINKNANWFNQNTDEWVILLSGSAIIEYSNNYSIVLEVGNYLFIPKNTKHRVIKTHSESGTSIWLAIHF